MPDLAPPIRRRQVHRIPLRFRERLSLTIRHMPDLAQCFLPFERSAIETMSKEYEVG